MSPDSQDYRAILLGKAPLLDVRAPLEFTQGSFPGAVNLPLMNDEERHLVGLQYKRAGQDSAIRLGHQLVHGAIKEERVARWAEFARTHPEGYLYCFRGGLRSQISQQWLAEAGIPYPRIIGGYKAMRGFLLEALERTIAQSRFVLVAGFTGSGKTDVIACLRHAIDLEALAHHRGSSFGKHATDQPMLIDFDNRLAIALLRMDDAGVRNIVLEDESRLIGRCALPNSLREAMLTSKVVWIDESLESRVERILRDYVEDLGQQFDRLRGSDDGFGEFAHRLLESLQNVKKRLGGERHARLDGLMREALAAQREGKGLELHREWIRPLLTEYYDPMYAHQRAEKASRILVTGDRDTVTRYLLDAGY